MRIDLPRMSDNERRANAFIRELVKKARKGNWAWKQVEALQGYEGDYDAYIDVGDRDER